MRNELYAFAKPDFELIRMAAYELLLNQKSPHIGMRAENIAINGKKLIFNTIQDYALVTGAGLNELTIDGKIKFGYHVNLSDKIYLLLHNEDITSCCENWTNYHEIGHICLGHQSDSDKEEVEAHFFAACFIMPDPIIRYIESFGHNINKQFLIDYFKVSPEAAEKKINTLRAGNYETCLDSRIVGALHSDINYILRDLVPKKALFVNFACDF